MEPVRIDTAILRTQLRDVVLRPGLTLPGRVAERNGEHGILVLGGVPLVAKLPMELQVGERMRLQVLDASGETVQLQVMAQLALDPAQLAEAAALAQQAATPPRVLPLGEGRAATVQAAGDGSVSLRYECPALGRLDLRLDAQSCAIHAAGGAPADTVRAAAGELKLALQQVLDRPVQVTVHPRTRTLDVSA